MKAKHDEDIEVQKTWNFLFQVLKTYQRQIGVISSTFVFCVCVILTSKLRR